MRKEKSVSVRCPQILSKCTKIFNPVTTSDDPVIEKVIIVLAVFFLPSLSLSLSLSLFNLIKKPVLKPLFCSLLKLTKIIVKSLQLMPFWLH